MKRIKPTPNEHHWPRNAVPTIECRKRDLVIRISDWTQDKEEPAFDVECYIGGVYDFNESGGYTIHPEFVGQDESFCATKEEAKQKAIAYAQSQIAKLL